jgi:hypothetical protein
MAKIKQSDDSSSDSDKSEAEGAGANEQVNALEKRLYELEHEVLALRILPKSEPVE